MTKDEMDRIILKIVDILGIPLPGKDFNRSEMIAKSTRDLNSIASMGLNEEFDRMFRRIS